MGWNSWVIRNVVKNIDNAEPPQGWEDILPYLKDILPTKNIDKIEMTAFVIIDRDGRRDPNAIQMGHHIPLSKGTRQHNARNIAWAHRSCNQIQSEQTLDEVIKNLKNILEGHGYSVSKNLL